ncbi:hypothetical protein Btru_026627 [Bulinus truncatus]|nr:hypothetical protein Btru_026627 [Bulinus truncatus]
MILPAHVIMPEIRVDCNSTIINGTFQFIINFNPSQEETNSTKTHDSLGAMRFTIAVVLVYGIGVIGLLGISARRNRRVDLMDKEVNKFIKTKLSKYDGRKVRKQKRTINKLISSLHSIIQTDETWMSKPRNQIKLQHKATLSRSNTWSGHIHNHSRLNPAGHINTINVVMNPVGVIEPETRLTDNCHELSHLTTAPSMSIDQTYNPTQDAATHSTKFKVDKKVTFSEIVSIPVSPV